MKINKNWSLEAEDAQRSIFRPYESDETHYVNPATKKEMATVTIVHYPNKIDFTPIVFADNYVHSEDEWDIKVFYRDLCRLYRAKRPMNGHSLTITPGNPDGSDQRYRQSITTMKRRGSSRNAYIYRWGCRWFSKGMLKELKQTMEEEYTKKQLGIA